MNTPVTSQTLIEQWAPHTGYVRRQVPSGGSDNWSEDSSPLGKYIRQLRKLGLEDPTDATDLFDHAVQLREASNQPVTAQDDEATITFRLARGEITPAQASKLLAKATTPDDRQERLVHVRQGITNASREAHGLAVMAIHNYGEERWLAFLRPLAAEAYEAQDQQRWDQVQQLATLLRDRDLAALSIVATDQGIGREIRDTWRYLVRKPDEYHFWRLRHAKRAQNVALEAVGEVVFVASEVIEGPYPIVAQMDPSWEPGVYSAAEVVAIAKEIAARQDAAAAVAPNPEEVAR
jgi:hypothetical protein